MKTFNETKLKEDLIDDISKDLLLIKINLNNLNFLLNNKPKLAQIQPRATKKDGKIRYFNRVSKSINKRNSKKSI